MNNTNIMFLEILTLVTLFYKRDDLDLTELEFYFYNNTQCIK